MCVCRSRCMPQSPQSKASEATLCRLVYLDIGSNIGDSLGNFARLRPELCLAETLQVAVGSNWSPKTTCAYGFEPNPRWTKRLQEFRAKEAKRFSSLTIYTETAVGGPEQLARPLWIIPAGVRGIGATLSSSPPT